MTIYWAYITGPEIQSPTYVAMATPLKPGVQVSLRDTLGYIQKEKEGSWGVYSKPIDGFLTVEPNARYAKARLEAYLNREE
ncbi:MAG: hypothetical protein EHM49_00510 [Deltaproteobacteria bacterium]|nr:MAG: hypothetical protein EHM49_00510 [Deltaproteobacteria bacterium]